MADEKCSDTPGNSILFWHLGILLSGFIIGTAAAVFFTGLTLDFSGELKLARELGIISPTIIAGYAKKRDIFNYVAIMGFPILFAVAGWLLWAKAGGRLQTLAPVFTWNSGTAQKDRGWQRLFAISAVVCLVLSFNLNNFHYPYYNETVGAWPSLGEEGANLAWVQSIFNGGVYGKDFHCLYGPMLVYPLAWLMKLTGTTAAVARHYTYGLDLLAYGIIFTFLYKTLRTKTVFILGVACYFLVFGQSPKHLLAANTTYLRVALGIVPIFLAYCYLDRRKKWFLPVAGLVAGQSMLFSQEVGICATLAVIAMLVAAPRGGEGVGKILKDTGGFFGGIFISLLPMMTYFAVKGALGDFVDTLAVHPRLLGLGFTALPFPDLRAFLLNPLGGGALLHYWVIGMYIASALYLIPMLLMGRRDPAILLRSALLLFGALLYRAALARSDGYHAWFVSPPAFFLLFLFLDGAVAGIRREAAGMFKLRLAAAGTLLGALLLLCMNDYYADLSGELRFHWMMLTSRFKVLSLGAVVPQVPRADIQFDPQTAGTIYKIDYFLNRHTRPGDNVYFFPNEAAYYFLFNRNNPTRYVVSYFAVTRSQRLELIRDLDKKRPEYVVYSLKTWRMDNISERLQMPEVCDYLQKNYHTVEDHGDVLFLKRNPSPRLELS